MDALRQYYHPEDGVDNSEEDSDDSGEDFYSDQAILKRESLRFDPKVIQSLTNIWNVVDENHDNSVDFQEYFIMFKRLIIILRGREHKFDAAELASLAAKEFTVDAFGQETIDKPRFFQTFFQIADHWTHQICAEEYKQILDDLLGCMTGVVDGAIVFRDVDNTYTLDEYRALPLDHPDRNRDLTPKSSKKDDAPKSRPKSGPSANVQSSSRRKRTTSGMSNASEEVLEEEAKSIPRKEISQHLIRNRISQMVEATESAKKGRRSPVETPLFESSKPSPSSKPRATVSVEKPALMKLPREYKQPEKSAKKIKKRVIKKQTRKTSSFSGSERHILQHTHIREGARSTFHWTSQATGHKCELVRGSIDGTGSTRQKVWREKPKEWAEKMKLTGCLIETDGCNGTAMNQIDDKIGLTENNSCLYHVENFSTYTISPLVSNLGQKPTVKKWTKVNVDGQNGQKWTTARSDMLKEFLLCDLSTPEPVSVMPKSGENDFEDARRYLEHLQERLVSQRRALQKNRSRGLLPGLMSASSSQLPKVKIQDDCKTLSDIDEEIGLLTLNGTFTHQNSHWAPFGCQEDFLDHERMLSHNHRLQDMLEQGLHDHSPLIRLQQQRDVSRAHTELVAGSWLSSGLSHCRSLDFDRSSFFEKKLHQKDSLPMLTLASPENKI
jgi:hypothetical protein